MSTDPVQGRLASSDPAGLRRDIEEVRGELADTVNALAAKADVQGRAKDKAREFKAQAIEKAPQARAQATAKIRQLTGVARQTTGQAQRVVQDKPGVVAGAALAVLGLLVVRRGRRRG